MLNTKKVARVIKKLMFDRISNTINSFFRQFKQIFCYEFLIF